MPLPTGALHIGAVSQSVLQSELVHPSHWFTASIPRPELIHILERAVKMGPMEHSVMHKREYKMVAGVAVRCGDGQGQAEKMVPTYFIDKKIENAIDEPSFWDLCVCVKEQYPGI